MQAGSPRVVPLFFFSAVQHKFPPFAWARRTRRRANVNHGTRTPGSPEPVPPSALGHDIDASLPMGGAASAKRVTTASGPRRPGMHFWAPVAWGLGRDVLLGHSGRAAAIRG